MFADPLSVTYAGNTFLVPAISRKDTTSIYKYEDGADNYTMTVSHVTKPNRTRYVVRVDRTKIVPDLLLPAANSMVSQSVYIVIDRPNIGFTIADTTNQTEFLLNSLGYWTTSFPADAAIDLERVVKGET